MKRRRVSTGLEQFPVCFLFSISCFSAEKNSCNFYSKNVNIQRNKPMSIKKVPVEFRCLLILFDSNMKQRKTNVVFLCFILVFDMCVNLCSEFCFVKNNNNIQY